MNIEFVESQKVGNTVVYICYIYGRYTEQDREAAWDEFEDECYRLYGDNISFESSNLSPIYDYDDDDDEEEEEEE